ncbi:ABC-F family ATP-binding cassette domain-containing protein [Saprospiraceae bacterium]|jgi:ATP-binding cassette subfamily F protein 3|nr:ABC-F family ATP-binding cassette domain-containing protein [Saprospiraceae bacterium]
MYYFKNISLQFGDRVLLDKINFMIGKKERLGLIGRNGAGKSTLLKIISGNMSPDNGGMEFPNDTSIGYLKQEFEMNEDHGILHEAMTCFEKAHEIQEQFNLINEKVASATEYESQEYANLLSDFADVSAMLEHYNLTELETNAIKILVGLGFKKDQMHNQVSTLSGGWKMRIELAKLLLQEHDILLLDEPTNHLDIESIIWLEKYLQNYPKIVILISHDTEFLNNVTNRIIEVELGKLYDYKGTYYNYIEHKKLDREIQQNSFENQQKVIAEKERTITRFMAKATKTKMAQSMQKSLDKMDRIEVVDGDNRKMNISFAEVPRSGVEIVVSKRLSKAYGDNLVLDKVDLKIERGERVAFVGQNGQGKTTLAKMIVGELVKSSGELKLGHNVQVSYYAQNQSDSLETNKTILKTMEDKAPATLRSSVRNILGSFMFTGEDVEKKVSVLSGGERARLAMALLMMHPCNLLVLDEPTNHLDIVSKDILKKALDKYEGALIVVSHDRSFLKGMTEKVIEFRDSELYEHLGDIEYFLGRREMDNMRDVELSKPKNTKVDGIVAPIMEIKPEIDHEELKKLKRQLQYVERDINKLEEKIAAINIKLADPVTYASDDFVPLKKDHALLKSDLDKKMEEWELVAEKIG